MHALQKLYDSEINFEISCFWDGGFDWKLGDHMNGYKVYGNGDTFTDAVLDLCEAARKYYPESAFATAI